MNVFIGAFRWSAILAWLRSQYYANGKIKHECILGGKCGIGLVVQAMERMEVDGPVEEAAVWCKLLSTAIDEQV